MKIKKLVARVGDTVFTNIVLFEDGSVEAFTFTEMNRAEENYRLLCEKKNEKGYHIAKVIRCADMLRY